LNSYLDTLRNKVHVIEREMIQDGLEITYQSFQEKWSGADEKSHMLLAVFKQHNDEVSQLEGKDLAAATLKRYTTSLRHTRNFIAWGIIIRNPQNDV
jgi:hypothetical protein